MKPQQRTTMGLHTAISVVVGSIIGSGIFMKPATMAAQTGSAPALIMVWVVAGILSLIGAFIFAEIGAMFPETGGLYVYLKKMYGDFVAFLYGWAAFTVINTASVAAISFVCAAYANYFLQLPELDEQVVRSVQWHIPFLGDLYPLKNIGIKALAILISLSLTWLNALSLKAGGRLQLISTLAKMAALIMLVFGILFSGNGEVANVMMRAADAPQGWNMIQGCMAALTGAFVAYDGWQNINFMGGEISNPEKNLPRSLILGVVSCITIYVMVNIAYAYALPIDVMATSPLVAKDALAAMLGQTSGAVIAALIVVVTIGAVNGNVMSTARVTQAMGQDGLFPLKAGQLNLKHQTPSFSLWLHGVWICLLIISGSFDMLADMFVFVTWVFIIITCLGMMKLRRSMPHHPRPFKMWGYPWLLLLFTAFACFYVYSTLQYEITAYKAGKLPMISSLLGLAVTVAGIPVYMYFRSKRRRQATS